jgi:hypothetical protein
MQPQPFQTKTVCACTFAGCCGVCRGVASCGGLPAAQAVTWAHCTTGSRPQDAPHAGRYCFVGGGPTQRLCPVRVELYMSYMGTNVPCLAGSIPDPADVRK